MLIVPERNVNGAYFLILLFMSERHGYFCEMKETAQHTASDSPRLVPQRRELVGQIDAYVAHYNAHKRPFVWTATADSIFDQLQRICKLINGTQLGELKEERGPPRNEAGRAPRISAAYAAAAHPHSDGADSVD
jgi:hypothetical protein